MKKFLYLISLILVVGLKMVITCYLSLNTKNYLEVIL